MPEEPPIDTAADEALVARLLLRDSDAIREFYERFNPLIRAASSQLFPLREVDDVAQEVWAHICARNWRVVSNWNKTGPLSAYVMTVCRNKCFDILRRLGLDPPIESDPPELEDPRPDPEALQYARELRECLGRALAALSETYRRIIKLRHFEGLKHAEIAERLGKTIGYVGPTLRRAERYLRDEIREHCGDHLGLFGVVVE